MATQGRNEGFSVLDDFVCEAILASSIPVASPTKQGQNSGMNIVEEVTVTPTSADHSEIQPPEHPMGTSDLNKRHDSV
ncbi:MAG: hypothetical protein ACRC8S_17445 [Fimbriiglobus sp.]